MVDIYDYGYCEMCEIIYNENKYPFKFGYGVNLCRGCFEDYKNMNAVKIIRITDKFRKIKKLGKEIAKEFDN